MMAGEERGLTTPWASGFSLCPVYIYIYIFFFNRILKIFYLFIFWLCWVFIAVQALSNFSAWELHSS